MFFLKRGEMLQVLPLLELTTLGQEDCLVVNVHTKEINPSEKKAVMVWIHGGGFWFGSGVEYQPMFAMDHDIVIIRLCAIHECP